MLTLASAFALAWVAVAFYGLWLGLQQHQLRQRLDALETQDMLEPLGAGEESCRPRSRAA